MGIKDLNQLMKPCFRYLFKEQFKNQRIALDFLNFWYMCHGYASKDIINTLPLPLLIQGNLSATKEDEKIFQNATSRFIDRLYAFLRFQIIPVVIFEGMAFPEKEPYAGKRRMEERNKKKMKMEELRQKFLQMSFDQRPSEKDEKIFRTLFSETVPFDRQKVSKEVKKVLDYIGIPYFHCVTEAEHLATSLCKEGYVIGIYTTDTDVEPLGCPCVISKEGSEDEPLAPMFRVLHYETILRTYQMNRTQFIDMCILAGCDYNERIKMMNKNTGKEKSIGIKTAFKLIQQYGSIEKIIANEQLIGVEKLEYEKCRNIFDGFPISQLCPDFTYKQFFKQAKDMNVSISIISGEVMQTLNQMRNIFEWIQSQKTPFYDLPPTLPF